MDSGAGVLSSIPRDIIEGFRCLLARFGRSAAAAGLSPPTVDAERILTERVIVSDGPSTGWPDRRVSVGGAGRMLLSADGVIAVNLIRASDWELVPAWLRAGDINTWDDVALAVGEESAADLVERAVPLGLPVAEPGDPAHPRPVRFSPESSLKLGPVLRVVDISSLWAGPLAGRMLAAVGADVTKVESIGRPDGLREGLPTFYAALNSDKNRIDLDLASGEGRGQLAELVSAADVVIDASRPRAMEQIGVDVGAVVRSGTVWVSITGYGRHAFDGQRVGFGDDVAVAGGAWVDGGDEVPWFVGDALGDPITGVYAATAAVAAVAQGAGGLAAVVMRDAVAAVRGGAGRAP